MAHLYANKLSGGFGSFMLAMSPREATETKAGPDEINVSSPNLGKLIAFYFLISFVGLFAIVPMRKVIITPTAISATILAHTK